jgi:hypothetical protein
MANGLTNALLTVLEVIQEDSGGQKKLFSSQLGTPAENFSNEYITLDGSQSKTLGEVASYLMIYSTDEINVTLTTNSGNITFAVNTMLILTAPFTNVQITNPGTTQIEVQIIIS